MENSVAAAADSVQRAVDYLRKDGVRKIADSVKSYATANPSHALIGAAVIGFFIGRFMSRD